jgi:hypothetical protein
MVEDLVKNEEERIWKEVVPSLSEALFWNLPSWYEETHRKRRGGQSFEMRFKLGIL